MNMKIKYCSIFLILTVLLVLSTGIVSASDINENTGISDNIQETVGDNAITPTDDVINSQSIQEKVDNTFDTNTTATSDKKELNKEDKNLKTRDYAITPTLTPNSGVEGDTITATFSGGNYFGTRAYTYEVKFDSETIKTGSVAPTAGYKIEFTIPETTPGEHTVNFRVYYSVWNNVGSATLTVESPAVDSKIVPLDDTVNGEIGSTVIPVTVKDLEGNIANGSSTLTFKDGDTVLLDNVEIIDGVASVNVPTNRLGEYPITVTYNGNKGFNPSTADINVNVVQAGTVITVNEDDEGFYQVINVLYNKLATGKLATTSNVAVAGVPITIDVDGTVYTVSTSDDGTFEFKYPATEIIDDVTITISYVGSDLYGASNIVTGSFDVEPIDLTISLDEVTLSEVNETTTISGNVIDELGNAVANTGVNLTISGLETPVTVTTDDNGLFSYDYIFGEAQDVIVTASKNSENGLYVVVDTTTEFTVVVGPRRNNLIIEQGNGQDTTITITDIDPYYDEVITNGTLIDIFGQPVTGVPIKILINDGDCSVTTDDEGKFTLIYNATCGATTYDISINFEGNDDYKPSNQAYTGTFTTNKFNVVVTLDDNLPNEILLGDVVTFSGSATLQDQPLRNNPIKLRLNGKEVSTITDDEGRYSYDYTIPRTGSIPVLISATYTNASVTQVMTTIMVDKPTVILAMDDINDILILEDITLNGRLYIEKNNTGIEDNLILKINNQNINLATNSEGYFTYTFTPGAVGQYNISITYDTAKYTVNSIATSINVLKRQSQIVSDKLPIAVKVHDTYKISGQLIDNTTAPIKNADIKLIIDGKTHITRTDNEGFYSYNYPANTVREDTRYEVRYSGDDKYMLAKNYVGSYFDVEAKDTKIKLNYTKIDDIYNITGKLTSENQPITTADVTLYFDENEVTLTTDENGIFFYEYTLNEDGTHTAYAQYTEDDTQINSKTITFTIDSITTVTKVNTFDAIIGKVTDITANVTDSNNNPVTGGKVVFKVNGKTIKDANGKVIYCKVEDGMATLTGYTIPESWSNGVELSAVYSGTTGYPSSRSDVLTVTARIAQAALELTPENITAARGEVVTITATVADESGNNMNGGKVILKLNGKTIKDANGKALYLTVEDGIASYDYTIPENLKIQTFTLTAVFTKANYEKLEDSMQLTVVKEKSNSTEVTNGTNTTENSDNGTIVKPENQTIKTDSPTTHIINNDNIDEYITANGLTDLVSPGDTLDIQGTIDKEHSLVIDKPINVISSTHDAVINLHTVAGSLMGEDPGNCFVVNIGGSGSNISSLYLYNTECWMYNNYDVTLYNMTMHVENAKVGSGVGQTSIRYCERFTMDSCYIYTENNGGSTSVALTGTSDALIKNTTIQGVKGSGQVGNILYLANPYNQQDKPANFTMRNTNITVIDSTILGVCTDAITIGVQNFASNCTFINNTINTTGNYGYMDIGANGVAIGNKFYQNGGIVVKSNCTAYDNVMYGTGKFTTYANTTAYNNVIYNLEYSATGNVYNNTITTATLYSNTELSGNTFTGDLTIKSTSSSKISNVKVSNNTINGNVVISGYNTVRKVENLQLTGNNIAGGVSVTQATNNIIANNTINGTVNLVSTATGTTISNNTIITNNQYAITNAAASTTMSDNYLISNNYQALGESAISDTTNKATITGNGPDISEFWKITISPIDVIVGESLTITVDVQEEINGSHLEDGEVYLMINDEIITDDEGNVLKVNIDAGQAELIITTVPSEWLRSDAVLTAVYTNGDNTKEESTSMDIHKRDATVEITTESLTVSQGQTITLTAEVTDNGEMMSGQIAFKVNGKSLLDDEDNLICVDVIDGVATLEYTFDDSYEEGSYELTAVFKNDTYYRSTDSKTLIIE